MALSSASLKYAPTEKEQENRNTGQAFARADMRNSGEYILSKERILRTEHIPRKEHIPHEKQILENTFYRDYPLKF
jgi:hypothetical protein